MPLPLYLPSGDLPPGVHRATLREAIAHFGTVSPQRMVVALRLEQVYRLAMATGHVARFVVFGSFVTTKADPNDVDVFLLMEDTFNPDNLTGEADLLFDHQVAQGHFGASVFWLRRLAMLADEQRTIEYWQIKRDGGQRGIVEVVPEVP